MIHSTASATLAGQLATLAYNLNRNEAAAARLCSRD
jgi:hypothetical protein